MADAENNEQTSPDVQTPRAVIWDTDCGVDDFMGLIVLSNAVQHGIIDLKAIVVTPGNVKLGQGIKSLQLLLTATGVSSKIFCGKEEKSESASGAGADVTDLTFHGKDGLHGLRKNLKGAVHYKMGKKVQGGLLAFPEKAPAKKETTERQVYRDMAKLAKIVKEAGNVTWITTGPLTTTSEVWRQFPEIVSHVDELISMGGAIDHPGNMNPTAEFNFYGDPKAVAHVLSKKAMTLFPLDVTQHCDFHGILDDLVDMTKVKLSERVKSLLVFLQDLMKMHYEQHVLSFETILALHDVLPCVYLLCPELFEFRRLHATIKEDGSIQTDKRFLMKPQLPNMTVAMHSDPNELRNFIRSCIVQLCAKLSREDQDEKPEEDGVMSRITSMNDMFLESLQKQESVRKSSSLGFLSYV